MKRFYTYQKVPKSTKSIKNITKQKHKNVNKRPKKSIRLKNIQGGKSHLFAYSRFCACDEKKLKSLYNGNVGLTKLIKVLSALYEQKLVY